MGGKGKVLPIIFLLKIFYFFFNSANKLPLRPTIPNFWREKKFKRGRVIFQENIHPYFTQVQEIE